MEADARIRHEARARFAEALDWLRGQRASCESDQTREAISFARQEALTRLVVDSWASGSDEVDRCVSTFSREWLRCCGVFLSVSAYVRAEARLERAGAPALWCETMVASLSRQAFDGRRFLLTEETSLVRGIAAASGRLVAEMVSADPCLDEAAVACEAVRIGERMASWFLHQAEARTQRLLCEPSGQLAVQQTSQTGSDREAC